MRYQSAAVAFALCILMTSLVGVEVGKPAPSIDGVDWLRNAGPAADQRIMVVDLFASWVPTMGQTVPELAKLQRQHSKKIQVVGISKEPLDALNGFRRQMGRSLIYPIGHIDEAAFSTWAGKIEAFPHTIIIDSSGVVRWQGHPLDVAAALAALD